MRSRRSEARGGVTSAARGSAPTTPATRRSRCSRSSKWACLVKTARACIANHGGLWGLCRLQSAKKLMGTIDREFGTLPWCRRYLDRLGESGYLLGVSLHHSALNPSSAVLTCARFQSSFASWSTRASSATTPRLWTRKGKSACSTIGNAMNVNTDGRPPLRPGRKRLSWSTLFCSGRRARRLSVGETTTRLRLVTLYESVQLRFRIIFAGVGLLDRVEENPSGGEFFWDGLRELPNRRARERLECTVACHRGMRTNPRGPSAGRS